MDLLLPWLSGLSSFISVIIAVLAFNASRSAKIASHNVEKINETVELALSRFREELVKDRLLVNNEVIDYRFKGEDDKIAALDHRTSRNAQHISLILGTLLKSGIDLSRIIDQEKTR